MVGTEIAESIVRQLAISIFMSLIGSGGKALGHLSDALLQKIYLASRDYHQSYIERHGTLKVLGMREPIPLDSVYVAAQFLDHRDFYGLETMEVLEEVYRRANQRGFQPVKRQSYPGIETANQKQYLMVLGDPGMGKTTFLRKVGLSALKGKKDGGFHHNCIPVFIELKGFRTGNINLEETIAKIFRIRGFPDHNHFTSKALERGKLLILLDGLDEVPSECMNEVIAGIQNFVDLYEKNRYLISCRLAAYRHNFRRFTDITLAGFTDTQIENFITNWFSDDIDRGQECWQKLINNNYAAAKELTHTPLLLTLICLLYQRAGQFPTNRATLYEKALRVLLEEWAGEKGIPHETIYKGLDTKRKELMLAEIAYHAFKEDRLFLHKREIASQIERVLVEMLPEEKHISGELVLKSIAIQHGILVERAEGIYSFSHLTFQEFLTAQYVIDNNQKIEEIIKNNLTDRRWREVILLLAGLKRADSLLMLIEEQAERYTNNLKLKNLLVWCDQITSGSEGHYKSLTKRTIALFFALDLAQSMAVESSHLLSLDMGIEYIQELALEIDSSLSLRRMIDIVLLKTLNIEQTIDLLLQVAQNFKEIRIFHNVKFNSLISKLKSLKIKFSDQPDTPKLRRDFIHEINKVWLKLFNLQWDFFIGLSYQDVMDINDYLYANLLMVQCRKSAVRVSQKTWHDIEERMLKSPKFEFLI